MTEQTPEPKDRPTQQDEKRPVGRPPLEYPDPIPDTPENVAKGIFQLNPNEPGFEWEYLKTHKNLKNKE